MNIQWRKSSRSGGAGGTQGDCVEVGLLPTGQVGLRDSKAPQNGHLTVGREALRGLVSRVKDGELDF